MRTDDPIDLAPLGAPSDNDTLTAVLSELADDGFAASYRPAPGGVGGQPAIVCGVCGRSAPVADLRVACERRMEGASDPDAMVLAVAARCPACGSGGVVVLGYGPNASEGDADAILALHQASLAALGGDDDEDGDDATADPGGDSDPDANEGFEPPSD
jgi:hypothetical protein